jgi:hypothetical protein
MTDAKEFLPIVQRFTSENFPVWKFQMTLIFGSRNLRTIVNGTEKKPASEATDAVVSAWTKHDMFASTILVQTIDHEIIKTLVGCKTSTEIWSNLCTLQEKQASQSVDKLQKKFFELKFQQKPGCYDFISSITLLVNQLKNLGDTTFNDHAIMTRILNSLPKVYNPLITAWNLLPKEQQSLELLKLNFLEEEEQLTNQSSTEDDTKAFAAWSATCSRQHTLGTNGRIVSNSNNTSNRGQPPPYIVERSGSYSTPARNTTPHYQYPTSTSDS